MIVLLHPAPSCALVYAMTQINRYTIVQYAHHANWSSRCDYSTVDSHIDQGGVTDGAHELAIINTDSPTNPLLAIILVLRETLKHCTPECNRIFDDCGHGDNAVLALRVPRRHF